MFIFKATPAIIFASLIFAHAPNLPRLNTPSSPADQDPKPVNGDINAVFNYDETLTSWLEEGALLTHTESAVVTPNDFLENETMSLGTVEDDYSNFLSGRNLPSYEGPVALLSSPAGAYIEWDIESSAAILVEIALDYIPLDGEIRDIEVAVQINGVYPYSESQQMLLNKRWITPTTFAEDRYQNQIMPKATLLQSWSHRSLEENTRLQEHPLLFKLDSGTNRVKLFLLHGSLAVGQIYFNPRTILPSYATYQSAFDNLTPISQSLISLEAEHLSERNSLLTRFGTHREPEVTPFALIEAKLNVINGDTYLNSGQSITYQVDVAAPGLYRITLKALQSKLNTVSYRRFQIDGQTPFAEAEAIPFPYNASWKNVTLAPLGGEPYLFYLSAGSHTLTFEATSRLLRSSYINVQSLMEQMNALSLNIKKLTGNTVDENREWDIRTYLPTIDEELDLAIEKLETVETTWKSAMNDSDNSEVLSSVAIAKKLLLDLAQDPNLIPRKINTLSGASGSVLYRLGLILPSIIESPLTLDKIFIHGTSANLPEANANFFKAAWIGIQRFFASFFSSQFLPSTDPEEVIVWVSRSMQYVNLLQQMVDAEFTPQSGVKVRISINPNEDKLILASSAGKQPDIAMGIAGWRPYDFAIRNNVHDLRTFDDFPDVASRFYPGAFNQLIYQDGVYGLPETQNFYLLFYRKDIMNTLALDIPDTWNDVVDILPELQRFGMNFYSMLSSTNAFKAFVLTMPFIQQFGGKIYAEDALSAAFDDPKTIEALSFMTDLYTTYSLPLEVGSFYNEFRYGRLPIGIGDFGMYITLLHAAPEIAGLWDIAPLPGVYRDGEVNRSFDGASTSAMIFKDSDKVDQSWSFLKWWTSQQTQLDYAENLISAYGPEYMWNTANVEAFSDMAWNENHQATILEQWRWIQDTAKTPASYMLEREISNIWNNVVYQGVNLRTAIEDSLIITDKEITRKMIEFGFIDRQGNILKPYILPTPETLDDWLESSR